MTTNGIICKNHVAIFAIQDVCKPILL